MSIAVDRDGPDELELTRVLEQIAAGAAARERDLVPPFPEEPMALLGLVKALAWGARRGGPRPPAAAELDLVRQVARADGSVGRIFDGHLNAVERLAVQGPAELRDRELGRGARPAGCAPVCGAATRFPARDPRRRCVAGGGGAVLRGVKTFCSGAGGIDRALVLARAPGGGPPLAVWIDVADTERVEIDTSWYRSYGLRASVSHRVVFHDAPVLAQFGGPGALAEQPWFGRDALRTAASWAGMADTATDGALAELAGRPEPGALEGLAVGRILTAQRTIGLWLDAGARAMDSGEWIWPRSPFMREWRSPRPAAPCSTKPPGPADRVPSPRARALDRARRDLEVFLLQHRLDPQLARLGLKALSERRP